MSLRQRIKYEKKLAKRARKNWENQDVPDGWAALMGNQEDPRNPRGRTLQSWNHELGMVNQENAMLQHHNNHLETICQELKTLNQEADELRAIRAINEQAEGGGG